MVPPLCKPLACRRCRLYTGPMSERTCDGRGFTDSPHSDVFCADSRCLFHSEDPNKPKQPMLDALEAMKGSKVFDCRGWVFPFDVNLSNQEFQGAARFDRASFGGAAWFNRASFGGA